jgi:hypothetical protein
MKGMKYKQVIHCCAMYYGDFFTTEGTEDTEGDGYAVGKPIMLIMCILCIKNLIFKEQ